MSLPRPTPPSRLGIYAREVLELLAGHAAAAEIVIGGGIALAHYVDYRDTFDLDAWWAVAPTAPANALVNRGAPRDLRDIYEVCRRGLLSASECWQLYEAKNPGLSADDATAKVLHALERLEIQRPLASIQDVGQRHEAAAVRNWYRDVFCRHST